MKTLWKLIAVMLFVLAVHVWAASAAEIATDRWAQVTATAGQTTLTYDFEIEAASDLVVTRTRAGSTATLVQDTDYTVAGVGGASGGTVTLTSGATVGDIYTLYGDEPYERETDFATLGTIRASEMDRQGDEMVRLMQQTYRDVSRVPVQYNIHDPASVYRLPSAATRASQVLGFDGAGAFTLVSPTSVSLPGSFVTTGGSTLRSQADHARDLGINPLDFGAVGDGVTDDRTAMLAAESYAESIGGILYLPANYSFGFTGQFVTDVSVIGYGATLLPLTPWSSGIRNTETLTISGTNDLVLEGFTVDAAGNSVGLYLIQADRTMVRNVRVRNAITEGIFVKESDDVMISGCDIENVDFKDEGGSSGTAAEGIGVRGSERISIIGCNIRDFKRSGIVTEDTDGAGLKTKDVMIVGNVIRNCHDADDAAGGTEACNGIWIENTSGDVLVANNMISDLCGNLGQTNFSPRGIVFGPGAGDQSQFTAIGNHIRGTEDGEALPLTDGCFGFRTTASSPDGTTTVLIQGNVVENTAGSNFAVIGGSSKYESVHIIDNVIQDAEIGGNNHALISVSAVGAEEIVIDGLRAYDITNSAHAGSADNADITFDLNAGSIDFDRVVLKNLQNMRFKYDYNPGTLDRLEMLDSHLVYGQGSVTGFFAGTDTYARNVRFTANPDAGANKSAWFINGGTPQTMKIHLDSCSTEGDVDMGVSGASVHSIIVNIENHKHFGGGTIDFLPNVSGTLYALLKVTNGVFQGYSQTTGMFRLGHAGAGEVSAIFNGNTFLLDASGGSANTPIEYAGVAQVRTLVMNDNVYVGANLWNTGLIGAADSDADNTLGVTID